MRNSTLLILASLLAAFTLAAAPVRADRIRMRSGKIIEGVLGAPNDSRGSAEKIRLWVGPSQIALPLAQIAEITTDSLADNLLIDARCQFMGQRIEDGAEKLGLAAQQGIPAEKITPLLMKYGDALTTAIPQMKLAAREGLSQALARYEGTPAAADPALAVRRLFLHIALGEEAPSQAIMTALGPKYFTSRPAESARLSQALLATLDAWAAAEDFASGEATLAMLRRIAPRQADDAATQFYLHWGSIERHNGRYESALRIYTRTMMRLAPQIAIDRTTTTLMDMEKSARENRQLLSVASLYETYAMPVCPQYTRARLAQIWRDEGRMRMWDNRLPEARQAFSKAEQYQKGGAARELAECEWRERRARLAAGDYKGHGELGQWCQEHELYEQALTELEVAQHSPALAADAGNRIATIRSKQAEARLAEIMSLYEAGDYARVVEETARFLKQNHPAGYLAQAKQLQDMTRETMTLRLAQRPQQAEALYHQAERALNDEDYAKAKSLLDLLTTHYRDTVTYPRASALAAVVEQKLAVAAMEAGRKPARAASATSATLASASISSGTQSQITNMIGQPGGWPAAGGVNNAPIRMAAPAASKPPASTKAAKRGTARTSGTQSGTAESRSMNKALNQLLQEGVTNVQ